MNEAAVNSIREVLIQVEDDADTAGRKAGMEVAASFVDEFAENLIAQGRKDHAQLCVGMANRIRALMRAGKIY